MATNSPTITCSATEATFLASLLGGNMLLGIQDPFVGWLTEEIQESWVKAKQALAKRRFVEINSDGGIVLDTAVAAMVGTWSSPDASFIITHTPDESVTETRYFHLTHLLAVEQASTAKSQYQLTALKDARAVYERILQIFQIDNQAAALGSKATLREETLRDARMSVKPKKKNATEVLRKAGLDELSSSSLAEMLAKPTANGALVSLARRTTSWEVGGFGFLEGTGGLWRLRSFTRDGENWIEVIPCNAVQAREEIRRTMNRILPEPLSAM